MNTLSGVLFIFFAVDETRVKLKPVEGFQYDYVNANFIDVS